MIRISKEDTEGLTQITLCTRHGCLLRSSAVTRVTLFARHLLSLEWRKRSVSTTAFYLMFSTTTVLTLVLSVIMEVLKVEQWLIYLANCSIRVPVFQPRHNNEVQAVSNPSAPTKSFEIISLFVCFWCQYNSRVTIVQFDAII